MINNNPTPQKTKWILRAIISVAIIATVSGATYALLRSIDAPRMTVKDSAESSQQAVVQSLDQLKSSAFKKLGEGDQAGAIKDFEQALVLARTHKDVEQMRYLEQQIDFAKTSKLPDQQQSSPPPRQSTEFDVKRR